MSEDKSPNCPPPRLLSLIEGAPRIPSDAASPDFEISPAVVSFNFFVAPTSPYQNSEQAEFLGPSFDDLDGLEETSNPQGPSCGHRHAVNDTFSVQHGSLISSSASIASVKTIIETDIVMNLSLERLCIFIDTHSSMQSAEIVRSSTFVEKKHGAPHRCVVLELRRPGKKNLCLRLERKPTSRAALISGKGRTPSNDVVSPTVHANYSRQKS